MYASLIKIKVQIVLATNSKNVRIKISNTSGLYYILEPEMQDPESKHV